ncbi:MAG: HNH endonuclease [Planctomycetota bacterium]
MYLVLVYRRLRFGYPFRRIPLTQGKFAIINPDDYPRLAKYKWHANKNRDTFYAQRKLWLPKTKREITIKMHRQIINVPDNLFVDHINGNGLDNRKANLRPATHSQNACNIPKYKTSRSTYKGVTWHKPKQKWNARIRINRNTISLGYFHNETDAAREYDNAARKYHGQFASLNFPNI